MTRTIADLRDLRALEMGTFLIVRRPTDLRSLVEGGAQGFAPADRKRIAIDCDDSPVASVDAARVTRVLARLVQLALVTSWHGARVAIRVRTVDDVAIVSVVVTSWASMSRATVESHGGRLVIAELPAGVRSQLAVELPTV